ncbi:hypothetical protein AWZ03_000726 [Drosophila navojoa]|uniref:Uncharacterized protein n=1 Tax=Drosophila navojoa TaxID=7232 RepID=A0A484BWW0_DRONA|nr:hypothetical protein AWZ03_000726 [Drosophila navojoa]
MQESRRMTIDLMVWLTMFSIIFVQTVNPHVTHPIDFKANVNKKAAQVKQQRDKLGSYRNKINLLQSDINSLQRSINYLLYLLDDNKTDHRPRPPSYNFS